MYRRVKNHSVIPVRIGMVWFMYISVACLMCYFSFQFHGELEVEKSGFEERYQLMLKEYQERLVL